MSALHEAIKIAGSQSALARAIGVKQQTVWAWLNKSKQVPAEAAPKIELATGGKVKKHELRPDLWSAEAA